jgi:hypothetical protein
VDVRAFVFIAVAACSNNDVGQPQQGAVVVETRTCASVVANVMTIARREMAKAAPDMLPLIPKIADLTVKRCTIDGWSQAAITCMATARKPADTDRCQSLLTADQQAAVRRDMQSLAN